MLTTQWLIWVKSLQPLPSHSAISSVESCVSKAEPAHRWLDIGIPSGRHMLLRNSAVVDIAKGKVSSKQIQPCARTHGLWEEHNLNFSPHSLSQPTTAWIIMLCLSLSSHVLPMVSPLKRNSLPLSPSSSIPNQNTISWRLWSGDQQKVLN